MAKKKAEPESNGHTDAPLPVADSNLSALEKAHYAEIREKEKDVRRLACIADDKKADASAAKKAFEAADLALRNLISRGPYQAELPFGEEEKPEDAWHQRRDAHRPCGCGIQNDWRPCRTHGKRRRVQEHQEDRTSPRGRVGRAAE